jgi:hypothetical protein
LKVTFSTAGAANIFNLAYVTEVKQAAKAVPLSAAAYERLLREMMASLAGELDGADGSQLPWELLDIVAAVAERSPATFYQVVGVPNPLSRDAPGGELHLKLEALLVRTVCEHRAFTSRAAAMVLLSHLRWLTPAVCRALIQALADVPYVQAAALAGGRRYRYATPAAFEHLVGQLEHADASPLAQLLCAQLLVAVSAGGHFDGLRDQALASALIRGAHAGAGKIVYALLPGSPFGMDFEIRTLGDLGDWLMSAVTRLANFELAVMAPPQIESSR